MHGNPMHENWEIPSFPTNQSSWTCWEGEMLKPTMHEDGKSDNPVVSMKRLNEIV